MWPALFFIRAVAYSLASPPWQRRQKSYYTKKFFVVDPGFKKQWKLSIVLSLLSLYAFMTFGLWLLTAEIVFCVFIFWTYSTICF